MSLGHSMSLDINNRLIISTRWRFLFYVFPSRPGELHWVDILLHWVIFSTDPAGSKIDLPCFSFKYELACPFCKRVALSAVRFKLGRICSFKNVMYASVSKYVTGKHIYGHSSNPARTQYGLEFSSSKSLEQPSTQCQ
jgi:hypothetical protein